MTRWLWPWAVSMAITSTLRRDQFLGAFQEIAGGADGRAHAQAALLVLGGVGIFQLFLNVLDGDEALQVVLIVHDQQFFDAVLVEDGLGFFERGADGNGDEVVLGHHVADGHVGAGFEAKVAIGQDADEACAFSVTGTPEMR